MVSGFWREAGQVGRFSGRSKGVGADREVESSESFRGERHCGLLGWKPREISGAGRWGSATERAGMLELAEDVAKQGCERIAAGQRYPDVAHRDSNQRSDLEQFEPQRGALGGSHPGAFQ